MRNPTYTAVGFLSCLEKVFRHDEVLVNFHYFTFAVRCHQIIGMLVAKHERRCQTPFGFGAAVQPEDTASTILKEANTMQQSVSICIQSVLSEEEESLISKETTMSSGYIPDADKPYHHWQWGLDWPGFLNGKKLFGPETPRDYKERKDVAAGMAICSRKYSASLPDAYFHQPAWSQLEDRPNYLAEKIIGEA